MYVTQTQTEQRSAPDGAEAPARPKAARRKWTARKSLVFVIAAASLLWMLIIYAATQIL